MVMMRKSVNTQPFDRDEAVRLYRDEKASLREVAEKMRYSYGKVQAELREAGVLRKRGGVMPADSSWLVRNRLGERLPALLEDAREGTPGTVLAQRYDISATAVTRLLLEEGVRVPKPRNRLGTVTIHRIRALRAEGVSPKQIARQTRASLQQVYYYLQTAPPPAARPELAHTG